MKQEENVLLDIEDLVVEYHAAGIVVQAVNHINLRLCRGETLGLVGETGAGKSTTALSILKLLPERTAKMSAQKLFFDNTDLLSVREADMRAIRGACISMIFQDPMTSLNPVMTVGDQIAEAIALHNAEVLTQQEIQKRSKEMLELVGIPAYRSNDYPHQFSGGMKQRVVIAIALACQPELLIADEPTTALDVTIQAQVLQLIADLKEQLNTSMILITHDLGIVAQTCSRVAIMYAGEIVEIGTAKDIFEADLRHPYTIGLFDSIPDLALDVPRLRPIEGLMPDPTALPSGCKFHPRCPQCMEICKVQHPSLFVDQEHQILCHLMKNSDAQDLENGGPL